MKNKTMKEIVGVVKAIKYIESLDENTSIISHTVNGMFHYIITETEVKQGENEIHKLEQRIELTRQHFVEDLKNSVDNMQFYYDNGNMIDYNLYKEQTDGIIERYGEKMVDLNKRLDKLKNHDKLVS